MSANKIIEFLLIGAFSVLVIALALLSRELSTEFGSIIQHNIYSIGVILALIVYQPHFLATYRIAYSYKLKDQLLILVILPIFFVIFIFLVAISDYLSVTSKILYLLKLTLVFTLLGTVWHFSKQTYGIFLHYAKIENNEYLKKVVKYLFISTPLYGLLNFINLNSKKFELFNLSLSIPFKLDFFLELVFYSISSFYIIIFLILLRTKSKIQSLVVFIAFYAWYANDFFLVNYFYLIPIFHSLQFIPFYFKRFKDYKKLKNKIISWLTLAVLSIFLVFLIPNFTENSLADIINKKTTFLFVSFLLCINLHHFAMENFIWSKNSNKSNN